MNDWEFIKWALNWSDKSGVQRDCLALALALLVAVAWALFLFALS